MPLHQFTAARRPTPPPCPAVGVAVALFLGCAQEAPGDGTSSTSTTSAGSESTTAVAPGSTDGGSSADGSTAEPVDGMSSGGSTGDSGSTTGETGTGSGSSESGAANGACGGPTVLLYERTPTGPSRTGFLPGAATTRDPTGFIRAAEEFEVADPCWCIERVVVFGGEHQDARLTGEIEIGFHDTADGLPVDPALRLELGDSEPGFEELGYTMAAPLPLQSGSYWLAPMPTVTAEGRLWLWWGSAETTGSSWTLHSDLPTLAGCEDWLTAAECGFTPETDRAFQLFGTVGGPECQ